MCICDLWDFDIVFIVENVGTCALYSIYTKTYIDRHRNERIPIYIVLESRKFKNVV